MKNGILLLFLIFYSICFVQNSSVADEDKTDSATKITLTLPQNITDDIKTKTESVKIDQNTTANITIKTKDNEDVVNVDKKNQQVSVEIKNKDEKQTKNDKKNDKKDGLFESEKKTFLNNNNDKKTDNNNTQNININGDYDVNKLNVIKIIDGVKNININFQPNVSVGCNTNCNKKTANNKNTKTITKKKSVKKNVKKQPKQFKQNNDIDKNKIKEDNKHQKQQNESTNLNNGVIVPVQTKNIPHNSLRKFYENSEMSCVGNECRNIALDNLDNQNIAHNSGDEKTIIIKEQSPVYVINRIINIDEDMELSDDELQQLANQTDGQITILDNSENLQKKNNAYSDLFKQKYDIITANNMSYGEVAFIEDYNE